MSASAVHHSLLLVAAAIVQKLVVFGVNQLSLAYTTPEVIGQASIQLELWLSTSLFISREAIRITCLRYDLNKSSNFKRLFINLSWLPTIFVVVISVVLLISVNRSGSNSGDEYDKHISDSTKAYYLYSFAAFVETLGEPFYNLYNNQVYIEPRIRAETAGFLVKSFVTFITVAYFQMGLVGFGLAQLSFAVVYLVMMIFYFTKFQSLSTNSSERVIYLSFCDMLPSFKFPMFSTTMLTSMLFLSASSVVKHLLTEADKISLTLSCTAYDQGIYAITNNYGSLVARLLYLPLEDSTRISLSFLNKTANNGDKSTDISKQALSHSADKDEDKPQVQHNKLAMMKSLLLRMLKVVLFVGMGIATLGPAFVGVLTTIILRKNSESHWNPQAVASALTFFCYYLLFMGINGLAEAFIQVVVVAASSKDFFRTNMGLLLSSGVFALTGYYAVPYLGSAGIIVANIFAVGIRILWNFSVIASVLDTPYNNVVGNENSIAHNVRIMFIRVTAGIRFLSTIIPQLWWWVLVILIKIVANSSEKWIFLPKYYLLSPSKCIILHLFIGILCGVSFVIGTFATCSSEEQKSVISLILNRLPIPLPLRHRIEGWYQFSKDEYAKKRD